VSTAYIPAGQSNAVAYGTTRAEIPSWITVNDHVHIWDWKQQQFVTMRPGFNTNGGLTTLPEAWGSEVEFAYQWLKDHPGEDLYVIKDKAVQGLTALALDDNAWDWSPESTNEQYFKATTQITAAKAVIPGSFDTVVAWSQGEHDAIDGAKDAAYGTNLADLVGHTQADWDANFFLISRIADEWGADSNVRAVETSFGGFNTDEYPMQADLQHFTGAGAVMLGDDFYAAYNQVARNTDGTDADDRYVGSSQHDYIHAGAGNDNIVGGAAFDDLHGCMGNDTVRGGTGDDWVVGGKDNDVLQGDDGADLVYGNLGADTCVGGLGADTVRGGQGDDVVSGGDGDDWVSGDLGTDFMTGGRGADVFHAFAGAGVDHVTDFRTGDGDRVQLDRGTTYTAHQAGGDVVVDLSDGAQLILDGVQLSSLTPGWIFVA